MLTCNRHYPAEKARIMHDVDFVYKHFNWSPDNKHISQAAQRALQYKPMLQRVFTIFGAAAKPIPLPILRDHLVKKISRPHIKPYDWCESERVKNVLARMLLRGVISTVYWQCPAVTAAYPDSCQSRFVTSSISSYQRFTSWLHFLIPSYCMRWDTP